MVRTSVSSLASPGEAESATVKCNDPARFVRVEAVSTASTIGVAEGVSRSEGAHMTTSGHSTRIPYRHVSENGKCPFHESGESISATTQKSVDQLQ